MIGRTSLGTTRLGGTALTRALSAAGVGGGGFVPDASFFNGRAGFALDYSDAAKLFQLSNGTTAVSANDDPIGYATDLSGNTRHATQATALNRPLYKAAEPRAQWDGSNDLMLTPAVNLSTVDKMTVVFSVRNASNADTQIICDLGTSGAGAAQVRLVSGRLNGQLIGSTGTSAVSETAAAPAVPVDRVMAVVFDLAGAAAGDEVKLYVDGALVAGTVTSVGPAGGGNLQNATFGIGALRNGLFPINLGAIFRIVVFAGAPVGDDLAKCTEWCAAPLA